MRIVSRALQGVLVVFVAATLAFLLLKVAPGDPYSHLYDSNISPKVIEGWRNARGFNRPVAEQYVRWVSLAARGDFGYSVQRSEIVSTAIAETLPRTIWLMSLALVASIAGGIALGAWQGAAVGRRAERTVNAMVLLAYAIPEFWLATLFMVLFGYQWKLFPTTSTTTVMDQMSGFWHYTLSLAYHMFLPWLALTCVGVAVFARYQRAAMREVIGEAFVRTARAKGLSERMVLSRHALRVAILPVLTVAGLWFPALLGGAVFVEHVFGWQGMGEMLAQAVSSHDYDLVAGCVIVGSAMTAAGSVLADVLREVVDPRLRA